MKELVHMASDYFYHRKSKYRAKAHYSLGIDIHHDTVYTVLLCYHQRCWQLIGYWCWQQNTTTVDTQNQTSNPSSTPIDLVHWQDCLHFLYQQLSPLGKFSRLSITLGIRYQNCAWLALPKDVSTRQSSSKPVNALATWQHQAAAHWQMPAEQVLVDMLPINQQSGIVVSIPYGQIAEHIDSLSILKPLSPNPPAIVVDTNITSLYKIWPLVNRDQLALIMAIPDSAANTSATNIARPISKLQGYFLTPDGVDTCTTEQLPSSIYHVLLGAAKSTTTPIQRTQPMASPLPINLWQWRLPTLSPDYCVAWHLAFQPPSGLLSLHQLPLFPYKHLPHKQAPYKHTHWQCK